MAGKTAYTQAIANIICEQIAEGKSLRSICAAESMPSTSTVCKWLNEQAEFSEQYARAREAQADKLAEEILEIADDGKNDTYIDENGNKRIDQEVVARSKLRVDARKWLASKMAPKKYGEKIQQEVTGANGGPVEYTQIERKIVRPAN